MGDTRFSEHAADVMTCLSFTGIGNAWIHKNMSRTRPIEEIVELLNRLPKIDTPMTIDRYTTLRDSISMTCARGMNDDERLVTVGDFDFPLVRGVVPAGDQPVALFCRGDLSLIDGTVPAVAVVGLLSPDPESLADEGVIVSRFVERGAVIVSGLALGCDSKAHVETLRNGGRTVAILPSTLRRIIPSENRELADQIVQNGGLLITEYNTEPESTMAQRSRFVRRDRLQALFADLVVLTASYAENNLGLDSGSRHALGAAAKYGIPRAVLPDRSPNNDNPKYDLNRSLVDEGNGVLILDPAIASTMSLEVSRSSQFLADPEPLFS